MPAGAERPGFRGACAGRRCAASHSGLPALLTRTSLIYPAAFFSATTSPGLTHLRNLRDAKVCSRRCEARPPEAGAELKCGSCLSSPPPTPSWASLPRGVPCTGGRSRGDPGWQTDPRSRSGPWTGSGPAASETRCKERPAPSGGGVTEGTRGPLRSRPGGQRFQALRAHGAAPLLQPGPHLTGRPPRTPIRAGGSRLGRGACARPPRTFAPPPLAAGRGRGRGRVRAGPGGRRRPFPPPHTHSAAVRGGAH